MPGDRDGAAAAALTYLLDGAPVLVLMLDARAVVVEANAHARRLLGDDMVGRPFADLTMQFAGAPRPQTIALAAPGPLVLTMVTTAGLPESFTFRFAPLAGGTLAMGALDALEQARLQEMVLSLNRELSNTTRRLHQANADLRDLGELKNQFLGMAAHDLHAPLNVVMTYAGLVLDEGDAALSAEHRAYLRVCLNAATAMLTAVDSFLDVAAIESGHLRLEPAPAALADILAAVVEMGRLAADKQQVTLVVEAADEARTIVVDAARLQQVLLNLVGNAIEHSLPGRHVWLTAAWDAEHLVLSVRDEGPGLTIEDQQRLFAPFEQVSTRKTPRERHVGIGLTIAQKIVSAHRGRIWIESAPGQGAIFRVALPVNPADEQA